MKTDVYHKTIIVKDEHLDTLNHVNNVIFLQWAQEVAEEHWSKTSTTAINDKYYWVVLNHYIEYKDQALHGDQITARTYVERNDGIRSNRIVEFLKDNKILVATKTTWCLMDRKKHRPTRIPVEIKEMFD